MSDFFSTCLLVQSGSTAPKLLKTEINLHPGAPFSPDQGKAVHIAGGFSSITPGCGFPLSATLQLNHDLSTLEQQELELIARAELTRLSEIEYRSYTVEADSRVCVLADNPQLLNEFLDQYGGVLDVDPLLVKGYSPDFPTITELNLDAFGTGCRLEYQMRSPINHELCTYCGACGQVCPEQCISENLFLDYNVCTLCKECEKVCEPKAIDIHSALSRVLEVTAVILLGNVRVDLPEGTHGVYHQDRLADYFSTISPCRIDETISCDNTICQYSGRLGRGCDLCLASCKFGAVNQNREGVSIDALKCEECGACVAVCPTGAIQNQRFSDKSFVNYFQFIDIPQDGTVVIGDENALHNLWWLQKDNRFENIFFLKYDTVQSLSLFHYLFIIAQGARRLIILDRDAEEANMTTVSANQIALANVILSQLYDIDDAIVTGSPATFDSLVAEQPVGSFGQRQNREVFVNRRQSLLVSLESLVKNSGRTATIRPKGYVPFATVLCDTSRCTHCMACLNDCRIKALSADSEQLTLNHIGGMCVGCGLCARICPEDALEISSTFTLEQQFFSTTKLSKAEPMACKSCGKVFGTRKSFERVMEILSKKEKVDTSHFEYCDNCRVVKLFESE